MEKRKPHYSLSRFKELFDHEASRVITRTARKGAAALGYMDEDDIVDMINRLCSQHFCKSMTAHHNSRIWQDVYKFKDEQSNVYMKLQLSVDKTQAVLIQMKRDEGED